MLQAVCNFLSMLQNDVISGEVVEHLLGGDVDLCLVAAFYYFLRVGECVDHCHFCDGFYSSGNGYIGCPPQRVLAAGWA